MTRAGRLVLALAALAPACAPPAAAPGTGDVVLLLAGNTLGGDDLAAELLQDMARATDVLGPVQVVAAGEPGDTPADLARRLVALPPGGLRAVVAVIGDRSLLPGVDPNHPLPESPGVLSSRDADERALEAALLQLEREARRRGAHLVLATTPLGQQGRVELPELVALAGWLAERGPVLDLAARFRPLERAALFADGLDRLDAWGHEELARTLYDELLAGEGWLPARTDAESRAREQVATLRLWAEARHPAFGREAATAIARADVALQDVRPEREVDLPALARERTRVAALAALLEGPTADVLARWERAPPSALREDAEVPGLAAGRRLCRLPAPTNATRDPVEAGWLALLDALERLALPPPEDGSPAPAADPHALALDLVSAHPERLEAWLALKTVAFALGPVVDVSGDALRTAGRLDRLPVSPARWRDVLGAPPDALFALPALLVASRPEAALRPRGAELERARRAARLGMTDRARAVLDRALELGPAPPSWAEERRLMGLSRR